MLVPQKNVSEVRETLEEMQINGDRIGYHVIYNWKGEKKEDNSGPIPPQNGSDDVEDIMAIINEN